jgi:hypothetical protein
MRVIRLASRFGLQDGDFIVEIRPKLHLTA